MGAAYFKLHALDQPVLVLNTTTNSTNSSSNSVNHTTTFPVITARDVTQLLETPTGVAVSSVDVESQSAFALSPRAWGDKMRANFDDSSFPSSSSASSPLNAVFRVRGTPFAHRVAAPEAVAAIDWRSTLSSAAGASGSLYQMHQQRPEADVVGCFLGANAFLDFQIAPGGRNTWLSVSHGELWAFLIPPTPAHLRAFQQWKCTPSPTSSSPSSASPPPSRVFLAELVDKCIKCVVPADASLVVPAGYALALFAAQGDDCSFFSGLFSATSPLDKQLQVVLDLELPSRQQQQQQQMPSAMASIWSIAMDASDTSSLAVSSQLWAAVAHYSRQLVTSKAVSDQEKLALRRALPLLRRWSASPSASPLPVADWAPTSMSEAHDVISRLEQALTMSAPSNHFGHASPHYGNSLMPPASSGLSPMASTPTASTPSTSASMPLPSLSATEVNYIYSAAGAADDWSLSDTSNSGMMGMNMSMNMNMGGMESFAGANGFQVAMQSIWGEYQHHEQYPMASEHAVNNPLGLSAHGSDASQFYYNAGGYHQAPPSSSSMSIGASGGSIFTPLGGSTSYLSPSPMGNTPSSAGGNYFNDALGRHGSVSSSVSATAMALGIGARPAPGSAADALVRHRASCHRCGNLRKKNVRCPACPHIFCQKCAEKMVEEHGNAIFSGGCPVCKERCCCGKNRSVSCTHKVSLVCLSMQRCWVGDSLVTCCLLLDSITATKSARRPSGRPREPSSLGAVDAHLRAQTLRALSVRRPVDRII